MLEFCAKKLSDGRAATISTYDREEREVSNGHSIIYVRFMRSVFGYIFLLKMNKEKQVMPLTN
jgi:hypothetical protein